MFRYGVVVYDADRLQDIQVVAGHQRNFCYAQNFDQALDYANVGGPSIGFCFADNEAHANEIGKLLSMKQPGTKYCVFQITEMWQAVVPEATKSKVTEKGVLPE